MLERVVGAGAARGAARLAARGAGAGARESICASAEAASRSLHAGSECYYEYSRHGLSAYA